MLIERILSNLIISKFSLVSAVHVAAMDVEESLVFTKFIQTLEDFVLRLAGGGLESQNFPITVPESPLPE